MSFMKNEIVYGEFWQADTVSEGAVSLPCAYFSKGAAACEMEVEEIDMERVKGYFARLSAPGHLDCTEWSGPFATKKEAEAYLVDTYGDDEDEDIDNDC